MVNLMPYATRTLLRRPGRIGVLLILALLPWFSAGPAHADNVPFTPGDIIVGLGSSLDGALQAKLRHFTSDGTTLLDTLYTMRSSFEETGPCFDASLNLFTTDFEGNSVSNFNSAGGLSGHITGLNDHPNSCIFDNHGTLFVGISDAPNDFGGGGLAKIRRGAIQILFHPTIEDGGRGIDWIDLAKDQKTLFYTSLGKTIKRFDINLNTNVGDFCGPCDDGNGGQATGPFFGVRVLPDDSVLVVDWQGFGPGVVRQYNSTGAQIRTYVATNAWGSICGDGDQPCFFPWAIALDRDGSSFWVADNITGEIFKFHLDGALLSNSTFQAGDCDDFYSPCAVTGLTIAGEPTVALTTPFTASLVTASITADNKVYDGTTGATISNCTVHGVQPGDDVTCVASNAAFANANVGIWQVSATVALSGADAAFYTLASLAVTTTASITAKPASVTPGAASKIYGAPDSTFTGTLSGFVASDNVTASYSRTAGETVAGNPYTISATLSPAGVLGNYNVTYNPASFTITPAIASVTPNAATKAYGAVDPPLSGTLTGFLAEDGVSATYSRTGGESAAGGPYTISATLTPAGALSNYTITYHTAAFTITKALASVMPNAATKTYGSIDPALTGVLSGFLAADGVTATYTRTAGESVGGSPYLISAVLSPASALGNYTISYGTAGFTITPAAASITPNPATKTYGTADPILTGTLSGFVDGVTATYGRAAGEDVAGSPYAITATLSPATALSNYTIMYNTAPFTITPATPVVTWADPADITYPTPLSGVQLNATANVPGSFTYSPSSGTVLNVGNGQLLSVLLTPGSSNYTTASAQVHINVLQSTSQIQTVNLGGRVWDDLNGNGIQDAGEPGLAGVPLTLMTSSGQALASQTTATDGTYSFPGVSAGTYKICAVPPAGFEETYDRDGLATPNCAAVTLASDQTDVNFGYYVPIVCAPSTAISGNFNGTSIPAGRYVWFNSVLKASGLGQSPVTIRFENVMIQFTANSQTYQIPAPTAVVRFTSAVTQATTTYDAAANAWMTTVPLSGLSGNTFLTGVPYYAAAGLPGGIKNVKLSGRMEVDRPGISINWQWAAGVYSSFSANLTSLGVKPVDDNQKSAYQNSDHAGTPENFKGAVVGGATGGGGSNYSGSYSATAAVSCTEPAASTTYTQGAWGATPSNNNAAALLTANFASVYPGGTVSIGGANMLTFNSPAAIIAFLPQNGMADVLPGSELNPTESAAGTFAGEVLALRLNVDFSIAGITRQGLPGKILRSGPLAGYAVGEVLSLALQVIGGNAAALPAGLTVPGLSDIVDAINSNYDSGTNDGGYLM